MLLPDTRVTVPNLVILCQVIGYEYNSDPAVKFDPRLSPFTQGDHGSKTAGLGVLLSSGVGVRLKVGDKY